MDRSGLAIITGGSKGIGAALARRLHGRGWKVGLIARTPEFLERLAGTLGAGSSWRAADVTDAAELSAAVLQLEEELGPCELLVASAGIASFTKARDLDPGRVAAVMRVNVEGVVNAVSAVMPGMLERDRGQLVVISSYAGWRGMSLTAAYSASKAAVSVFMESLRGQLQHTGIAVTVVHPGYVRTELTAVNKGWMPFLLEVDDLARRALPGILRRRSEVNVPWQMTLLVGFLRLLPNWAFDPVMAVMHRGLLPRSRI